MEMFQNWFAYEYKDVFQDLVTTFYHCIIITNISKNIKINDKISKIEIDFDKNVMSFFLDDTDDMVDIVLTKPFNITLG